MRATLPLGSTWTRREEASVLRLADERDVDDILVWRNQSANRDVSVQQHLISQEEHQAWWARTRYDPTRRVLVFEHEGRPLGAVNYFDLDPVSRSGAWGFYLDSESTTAEGTALMAWIRVMQEATDYAFDHLGLDVLNGEVLEHNQAVRMMNRRFHFVEGEPDERSVDGRTIRVIPISVRREDRRARR